MCVTGVLRVARMRGRYRSVVRVEPERRMNWIVGLVIFVASAAMIVMARPRHGVPVGFVEVWYFGWIYALTSTFGLILGVALVIADWPLK